MIGTLTNSEKVIFVQCKYTITGQHSIFHLYPLGRISLSNWSVHEQGKYDSIAIMSCDFEVPNWILTTKAFHNKISLY